MLSSVHVFSMGPLYNDRKLAILDCELRFCVKVHHVCLLFIFKIITIKKYADNLTKIILKCRQWNQANNMWIFELNGVILVLTRILDHILLLKLIYFSYFCYLDYRIIFVKLPAYFLIVIFLKINNKRTWAIFTQKNEAYSQKLLISYHYKVVPYWKHELKTTFPR